MNRRAIVELLLLGAIWGSSFLFMRMTAPEFGPVPLIAVRVGIAAVFLTAVLAYRGGLGELRGRVVTLFVLGAINSAFPFSLFAFSTLSLPAGYASVINATTPLFGAVVAYVWLREKLSAARIAGLFIGLAGVTILVSRKLTMGADRSAVAAGLLAGLLYGIAAHYTRKHFSGVSPLAVAAGSQIAATLLLLGPAMSFWPSQNPTTSAWFFAAILGIVCTAFAYMVFFHLIARVGPARAITVTYLIPVFGIAWGAIFLGESITWTMVVGAVVILLGTALATGTLAPRVQRPQTSSGPALAQLCKS